ncbi:hypothetical protein MP638_004004, partial [Amoeboaphelidium occidentale]
MSRFKGVPSECLAFPATPKQDGLGEDLQVGMDITSVMGVLKYSKDKVVKGKRIFNETRQTENNLAPFPEFIPKTNESNFQRIRDYAKKMEGAWIATLKCDGSSMTVWRTKEDGQFHVASRNFEIPRSYEETSVFWQMAKQYRMEEYLPLEYALQMEVIGPNVHGNQMQLKSLE